MKITMPIAKASKREPTAFIPTWVKAVRASVCISDLPKPVNIPAGKPVNLMTLCSLKDLQRSRILQHALKMGMVVEAKSDQIL